MTASNAQGTNWIHSHWLRRLGVAALGGALFAYGLGVGHYKWPPFPLIQKARTALIQWLPAPVTIYRGRQEVLQYTFTDPLIETDLYYPSINSLEGIREANQRLLMHREGFETAYRDIEILDTQQVLRPVGAQPVVKVRFRFQGNDFAAFAYGHLPAVGDGQDAASLIIPGSGLNQSLGIATGDLSKYHGILDALNEGAVIYTLIKPNEDFLAWHDGKGKKLSGAYIWNWHLNRGGSYSVSYLAESLAFMKWLNGRYKRTIIAGLSQGGAAALLAALQSKPTMAIIASGHSVLHEVAVGSGHDQLIGVPGYADIERKDDLVNALSASPTLWFFSWGTNEEGTYKIEAKEQVTATAIRHLSNVTIAIHDYGHTFPVSEIQSFINRDRSSAIQTKAEQ